MIKKISLFICLCVFLARPSQARVFMFEEETVAPFLKLRTGVSSMGNAPFRWQSASQYSGDDVDLVYGGEFGVYLRTQGVGVSLGVLVHTFDPVTGAQGLNASGNRLYTVDVEGLAYGPQVVFDFHLTSTKSYLWKLMLGGGYQFAKLESSYNFTVTGQALVGGQSQLMETYKQEAPFALLAIGTEFHMSGTTTLSVTAGYHYSFSQEWKYDGGGQNFAGAHSQGDSVVFEDASAKNIDWSYPFLQVGFHFYVDTIR